MMRTRNIAQYPSGLLESLDQIGTLHWRGIHINTHSGKLPTGVESIDPFRTAALLGQI